ncbi:hypothetical protein HCA15_03660 [Listeria booriae]|uniref:phage tail tape measure protein n=1 Tax=Listeria booriae TaxID=1552123 RepID=UPI00164E429A|nr:phage tail tape measure protein [Listeria booriae]MBC6165733.1 hypothetical protein [Listeria booriae]
MSNKESNIVLNFKMDGQVQYASTIKEINQVMNIAAKEYKAHIEAMGNDASATEKLSAAKKKLEIQLEGAQKRTEILRQEYEKMAQDTNVSTEALNKQYGKLVDAERAEASLSNQLDKTNQALVEQTSEVAQSKNSLNDLEAEQQQLKASSAQLSSEYKLQKEQLGENASEADKMALAHNYLENQMKISTQTIDSMERQLVLAKQAYGENSTEASQMATKLNEAKLAVSKLDTELNELEQGSDDAGNSLDDLGDKLDAGNFMEASDKIAEIGDKLKEIGDSAFESALDIDDVATRINNSLGLVGDAADGTKEHIINVFNTGVTDSFEDVGEAIIQVKQGIKGINDANLDDITYKAMSFSSTFDTDINETVRGANALITAYGMDADKAFDLMYTGASRGLNITGELADNLGEYATLFQESDYSAEEMFETLESGLKAGAYNLDKVNDVLKETGVRITDGSMAKGAEELGGNFNKLYKQMSKDGKGNNEIFAAMAQEISKIDDEQKKAAATSSLFGSLGEDNGFKVIQAMSKANKEVTGVAGAYDNVKGKSEELNESSKKQQWQSSLNKLSTALIPVGTNLVNTLMPVIQIIANIAKLFGELPSPITMVITVIGLLTVGVATLLPMIAAFAVVASSTSMSMGLLVSNMLPVIGIIAGIVAAIALLVTGFMWLWNNVEGFRKFWLDLWKSIQNAFTAAWNYIQPGLKSIADALRKFWEEYSPLLMSAIKIIGDKIAEFIRYIEPYWKFFWQNVGSTLKFVWDVIVATIKFALNLIGGLIDVFVGIFTGDWDRMAKGINKIWSSLWSFVGSILSSAKDTVVSKLHSLVDFANSIIQDMRDGIKDKFDAIYDFMTDPIGNAKDFIWDILQDIVGFFSNLDLKFPQIEMPKLPHFSLKGKFSLKEMTVPSLDVDWRAKGAIFTQPTIFGASGGKLQGAGEAGAEAALPLNDKTLGAIGRGIANTMGGGNAEIHLHIDTLIADEMASIDRLNQRLQVGAMKAKNMLGQR